jgi:hypothetical protein
MYAKEFCLPNGWHTVYYCTSRKKKCFLFYLFKLSYQIDNKHRSNNFLRLTNKKKVFMSTVILRQETLLRRRKDSQDIVIQHVTIKAAATFI